MKGYEVLKERIASRASLYFTHLLQQRGYEGKLRINHKENKLTIQVLTEGTIILLHRGCNLDAARHEFKKSDDFS